ncbi:MAG TPA: family 20 glycosylhydrolase [Bryobacteraceae bacterium]|nr:family 20 glycosylhydrolase [Bryobacteraceae bacterium]
MRRVTTCFLATAWTLCAASDLPVRGIHLMAPKAEEVPAAVRFITEGLPKHGVNLLVMEVNYGYAKRPEVADPQGLAREDASRLVAACRQAGIRLIPMINMLGHQSWAKNTHALLRAHPEFDETPGRYPGNEGIYCRSYCPLHPKVHEVIFDLMDELGDAFEADAFHVGMDEVFLIGEDDCPRCRGRNKAELFAGDVRALHAHLAKSGRQMWIWGDRFIDGETTGIGKWEASTNGTFGAIRQVPKDIVICDWHYEKPHPTAAWFALEGFQVVSSPWRKPEVALGQLELIRSVRANSTRQVAERALGVMQTTWGSFGNFLKAYNGEPGAPASMVEVVDCMKKLFAAVNP